MFKYVLFFVCLSQPVLANCLSGVTDDPNIQMKYSIFYVYRNIVKVESSLKAAFEHESSLPSEERCPGVLELKDEYEFLNLPKADDYCSIPDKYKELNFDNLGYLINKRDILSKVGRKGVFSQFACGK